MKLWCLILLVVPTLAFGAKSGPLHLRARVPIVYRIELTHLGKLLSHHNMLSNLQLPRIESIEQGGYRLVTVTHP